MADDSEDGIETRVERDEEGGIASEVTIDLEELLGGGEDDEDSDEA